jgi:FkbM family methyltransferase
VAFRIRKFAREHRRSSLVRRIASKCEKFLHGFYNEGFFELDRNGEARVIDIAVATRGAGALVALDVGANVGDWARAVLQRRPDATIHCFEIVPSIASVLRQRMADCATVQVHDFGLSSAAGEVDVAWNHSWESTSSLAPLQQIGFFAGSQVSVVRSRVDSGDAVAKRMELTRIDLLKIDVEGHEMEVLSGFREALAAPELRPRIIQFEYGPTWLATRHTLHEAHVLLEACGYAVGRLYPDGVDFKPYRFADDHFRTGNYVAAGAGTPLAARLAGFASR